MYRSYINSIKYICSVSYIPNRLKTLTVTSTEFKETVPLKENLASLPTKRIGGGVRGRTIRPSHCLGVLYFHSGKEITHLYSVLHKYFVSKLKGSEYVSECASSRFMTKQNT